MLLTADDEGRLLGGQDHPQPRARQNVIFELGYFIGRLSRRYVCALYERGVEIPSDFQGVRYIEFDPDGSWKELVRQELRAAGFSIS